MLIFMLSVQSSFSCSPALVSVCATAVSHVGSEFDIGSDRLPDPSVAALCFDPALASLGQYIGIRLRSAAL